MPIKPDEAEQLRTFLGNLIGGVAELGFKAYPLVRLYDKAKAEKLDFWELLLTDDAASSMLAKALEKHVAKLSPAVIASMRLVLNSRQQYDIRKKQEAESVAAAKTRSRQAPANATVGGHQAEVDV